MDKQVVARRFVGVELTQTRIRQTGLKNLRMPQKSDRLGFDAQRGCPGGLIVLLIPSIERRREAPCFVDR